MVVIFVKNNTKEAYHLGDVTKDSSGLLMVKSKTIKKPKK
jgi:hypothetical protein